MDSLLNRFGISERVLRLSREAEEAVFPRFRAIEGIAERNGYRVIAAMQEAGISEECLSGTTGYGYNDRGREALEKTVARAFGAEDALISPLIACGTHALSIALAGNLRTGDELLYITGNPYDTLEEVIGLRPSIGSLSEYGITCRTVPLLPDGSFDREGIRAALNERTRVVAIQRSRGYAQRPSVGVKSIGEIISFLREIEPSLTVMVDNCYGEFAEETEPTHAGADMIVGSLIKNPGGGLAPSGGYIAGTRECVEKSAYRMTAPGLGREVGATGSVLRPMIQGFFLAPQTVGCAMKAAVFSSAVFDMLGFPVDPDPAAERTDIITSVRLGSAEALTAFCEGIQKGAPVDSFVRPEPSPMPGYEDPVIMAAGTFVSGASIELSADGPLRPPYEVYFQGGLTYPSAKLGILLAVQTMYERGLLEGRLA